MRFLSKLQTKYVKASEEDPVNDLLEKAEKWLRAESKKDYFLHLNVFAEEHLTEYNNLSKAQKKEFEKEFSDWFTGIFIKRK
jgi:hypothetical protein